MRKLRRPYSHMNGFSLAHSDHCTLDDDGFSVGADANQSTPDRIGSDRIDPLFIGSHYVNHSINHHLLQYSMLIATPHTGNQHLQSRITCITFEKRSTGHVITDKLTATIKKTPLLFTEAEMQFAKLPLMCDRPFSNTNSNTAMAGFDRRKLVLLLLLYPLFDGGPSIVGNDVRPCNQPASRKRSRFRS